MANWGIIGRQFERMDWIERILWIAFGLGGSTVISIGPYNIDVAPAFKFILVALFLLVTCSAFYFRLGWLERAARVAPPPTSSPEPTRREASQPKSVSIMKIREIAEKEYGWDFASYSDQLGQLIGGLR